MVLCTCILKEHSTCGLPGVNVLKPYKIYAAQHLSCHVIVLTGGVLVTP